MPTSVTLNSYIIRIEDGEITNSGAITDTAIAAVLSEATIDGAKASIAKTISGDYVGNDTVNRAIPHSLGGKPKLLLLFTNVGAEIFTISQDTVICVVDDITNTRMTVTNWDDTNFYVGNAGNYAASANLNPRVYYWKAIL